MGDDDTYPSVEINLSSEQATPSAPEYVYLHLDDVEQLRNPEDSKTSDHSESSRKFEDDPTTAQQLYLYTFEHENRTEELHDTISELRRDFIFARGIVWPEIIVDEVREADTERLRALEWAVAVLPYMDGYTPADLPEVADQAERWLDLGD